VPLQKETVRVDLTNGMTSKRGDKHVIPTKLLDCVDYVFNVDGELSRRNGHDRLCDGSTTDGGTVTAADLLTTFREELIQATKEAVYSFSSAKSKLVARGKASSVSVRKLPVIRNTATQTNPDWTTDAVNSWSAYAWEDSRGGIRYSIVDEATGAPLKWDVELTATGVLPRVILLDSFLVFLYVEGANLKCAHVARTTAGTAALTTATVQSDVHGTQKVFDALAADDDNADLIFVAYQNTTPELARFMFVPGAAPGASLTSALANNANAIAVARNTNDRLFSIWSQATVGLRTTVDTFAATVLTNVGAATTVDAGADPGAANLLTAGRDTTAGQICAAYLTDSGPPDAEIRATTIANDGSAVSAGVILLHCQPAGRLFTHNSALYLPVVFDSTTQAGVFLLAIADRRVVAKALPLSGALTSETQVRLGSVVSLGGNSYGLPVLERGRLELQSSVTTTDIGVTRLEFGFDRTDVLSPTQFGDALQLPSAAPQMYDGVSAVELGFHVFPERVSSADNGAGNVDVGTRQIRVTYEWTDAQGRRHQSPPSIAISHTVAASAKTVDVTVQTLSLTEKSSNTGVKAVGRGDVDIVVWATVAGGTTTFYRAASAANDPSAATVTITYNVADADLDGNEILYTVGGTLDYFAPPAHRVAWSHHSQLFVAGCENAREVHYSLPLARGDGPAFYPERFLLLPEDAGEVTAGASFANRVLVFTADRVAHCAGEGQDALGNGAGFAPFEWLSVDVGCTDARSVVEDPQGRLWFKTRRGLRALNPDLSLAVDEEGLELGSAMDDYAAQDVTGAVVVPAKQRIVWTTSSGSAIVFDTFWKQWSRFTGLTATGAALWGTRFVRVSSAGDIYREGTAYQDQDSSGASVNISPSFRMAWIQMAGLQGLQRVYRLLLLGDVDAGTDSLTVSVYSDFATSADETVAVSATTAPTQLRHHIKKQKCQAIQIGVSSSATVRGMKFSNLALEVGLKRGGFRKEQA
jgi:hypothetical protein